MKVTMPVTSMIMKVFIRLSLYFKRANTLTDARVFDWLLYDDKLNCVFVIARIRNDTYFSLCKKLGQLLAVQFSHG